MPRRQPTVPITIDDVEVTAYEGESILEAAKRAGIRIPTLCALGGLSVYGSCRLCLVHVAGEPSPRTACGTAVTEDMEVSTDTADLREHRRTIVELLFAEGNHICSVCVANGHCELQDLAAGLGVDHIRFEAQFPLRAVDASHPDFVFDPNRCVLCTRCVRTCAEIEGAHVWDVARRGSASVVVAGLHERWGEVVSCTACGKCVEACPTGALTRKGSAVGEAEHDRDVIAFLATARGQGEWIDRGERR